MSDYSRQMSFIEQMFTTGGPPIRVDVPSGTDFGGGGYCSVLTVTGDVQITARPDIKVSLVHGLSAGVAAETGGQFSLYGCVAGEGCFSPVMGVGVGTLTGMPGPEGGYMYGLTDGSHSVNAGLGVKDLLSCGVKGSYTPPPHCFPSATSVKMADGTRRAIKDIKVGDVVMAYNPTPGFVSRRAGEIW